MKSVMQNLLFDIAWAALETRDDMSRAETLALGSINVENLLGLDGSEQDLVATKNADLLGFESNIVAVISSRRGAVDIL
ncbi:hypothetical protein DFS33DRAFT_1031018 [Desarmillaria ectypa]|nr:hypothetical protein DFS33DRAFT_1031018 [Desarmillaria ectypa]